MHRQKVAALHEESNEPTLRHKRDCLKSTIMGNGIGLEVFMLERCV